MQSWLDNAEIEIKSNTLINVSMISQIQLLASLLLKNVSYMKTVETSPQNRCEVKQASASLCLHNSFSHS